MSKLSKQDIQEYIATCTVEDCKELHSLLVKRKETLLEEHPYVYVIKRSFTDQYGNVEVNFLTLCKGSTCWLAKDLKYSGGVFEKPVTGFGFLFSTKSEKVAQEILGLQKVKDPKKFNPCNTVYEVVSVLEPGREG